MGRKSGDHGDSKKKDDRRCVKDFKKDKKTTITIELELKSTQQVSLHNEKIRNTMKIYKALSRSCQALICINSERKNSAS